MSNCFPSSFQPKPRLVWRINMLGETTTPKHQSTANSLDQFVTVAKSLGGREVVEVIKQALDAPGVFTFTELTEIPSVQQVRHHFIIYNVHCHRHYSSSIIVVVYSWLKENCVAIGTYSKYFLTGHSRTMSRRSKSYLNYPWIKLGSLCISPSLRFQNKQGNAFRIVSCWRN